MTRVNVVTVCRNGCNSRDLVSVWKDAAVEGSSGRPVTRVNAVTVCHNGSNSRDSAPVW